jgi:xanthine phosphoribosyltransferase
MDNKIHIGWADFHYHCKILAGNIDTKYKRIIAITRGGLFVAGILSYLLDIREVQTLHIESYDSHDKKGQVKLFSTGKLNFDACLLVDDLTDSGDTLQSVLDWQVRDIPTAVLYRKINSKFKPTYHAKEFKDDWIVFPWDL